MTAISQDIEQWDAAVQDAAQYILRGYLHTKRPGPTGAQIAARIRHEMYEVLAIADITWTDSDVEKIAAGAQQMADWQRDHNVNWNDWAFGH